MKWGNVAGHWMTISEDFLNSREKIEDTSSGTSLPVKMEGRGKIKSIAEVEQTSSDFCLLCRVLSTSFF